MKTWNKINWSYSKQDYLCKWYLARLRLGNAIFKLENETIYDTSDHVWRLKFAEYCVQKLKNSVVEESKGSASCSKLRERQREITTFCSTNWISDNFAIFVRFSLIFLESLGFLLKKLEKNQ